jgi:predicted MFS family arabinose efflux permease
VGTGFVLMLPFVAMRAIARHEKAVFLGAIAVLGAGLSVLAVAGDRLAPITAGLVIFFAAFNVLEAKLPALVSKAAPAAAKGAASGVYSSVQFLGTFVGGAAGGAMAQYLGPVAVMAACLAMLATWLASAWPMREPSARELETHEPQATNP